MFAVTVHIQDREVSVTVDELEARYALFGDNVMTERHTSKIIDDVSRELNFEYEHAVANTRFTSRENPKNFF